ncbi:MAG: hypothetical protein COB78_07050 [Hyphomicrobiales bacterium]|nr:MAG: hypothetical protein COB78_07050 [Hyphomicrobiales bacterium]
MSNSTFNWNDKKAASNLSKHGVSFEQAQQAFRDPFAIEFEDDRMDYGEERFILIGMATDNILVVVHTERHDKVWIISARKAGPQERRAYHESNF